MAIAASLSQENATLWIIANQLFGEMARFSQTKTWYSGLLAGLRKRQAVDLILVDRNAKSRDALVEELREVYPDATTKVADLSSVKLHNAIQSSNVIIKSHRKCRADGGLIDSTVPAFASRTDSSKRDRRRARQCCSREGH